MVFLYRMVSNAGKIHNPLWRNVSTTEALKTCLQESYLLSRQREGRNIGYLRAKIVIVGSNKRVKIRDRAASFRVGGLKKNAWRKILGGGTGGGHACGFLFNFSKVTENANNDKAIDFFPHLQWSCYRVWKFTITKLKYHRLLCYTTDINL